MFRCPDCGQAHEIVAKLPNEEKGTFLLNEEMSEMTLIVLGTPIEEDHPKQKEYEQMVGDIDQSQEITCPECGFQDTLKNYIDAFNDPLRYFDTDQLCHCGGELYMDNIPGTSNYGWVCEECGWVKPNAVVSGAEGVNYD
jgi:predicted RNA-binding Zn-ribbon protein involved in translation (DUF1610 family)